MFKSLLKNQNIQLIVQKTFGTTGRGNQLTRAFELERAAYKKAKNEYIKKHQKNFWEEQTKVENDRIEEFMRVQQEKKRRDDAKLRSSIIINSKRCYESIKTLIGKQQEFIAKQKLWRQQDMELLMQKNDLLTMLDRQSKDWLTPQNIDEKLETELNNLLPPIIASHKDYYNRLVKFSFNIEQGKFEDAEDLKINKKIVEYKNSHLSPLYQELKTIIKYLTVTEENSAFDLYKETINRIKSKFNSENDAELKNLMQKITYDFKKLITLIRLENEKPENKLNLVENQLKSLVMILVVWSKYTDIIYKPEAEIEAEMEEEKKMSFHTKQRLEAKSLDELVKENDIEKIKNFYLQRITEKKGKTKGLFINEFLGLYDNPDLRKKVDKLEAEELKRLNSKDFNDPKYAKLFAEEATQSESSVRNQPEKPQASRKSGQEAAVEFEIKKARSFEISEASKDAEKNKLEEENKKKKSKKERAAVESSDLKMKKKKKASISETKRKLIENEAGEVFKDEEDFSEDAEEEQKEELVSKAKKTQEEIENNRKQLEDFEKEAEEAAAQVDKNKAESNISVKLREYYEGIKSEKLGGEKASGDKEVQYSAAASEKESSQATVTQEKKEGKKTRHLVEQTLENALKKKIDLNDYSMVDVKEKFDEYKNQIAEEFNLHSKEEKQKMAELERELDNIDISKIIDINEYENELLKEKKRMTLEKEFEQNKETIMQSEFFNTMIEYSKDIYDFKKPRITTNIDIYDEDLIKFFEISNKEAKVIYQKESTSLVMEFLKNELEAIEDEKLSALNRIKKKHLIRLADICSQMRIKDSHNLNEIFKMYKPEKISFDI